MAASQLAHLPSPHRRRGVPTGLISPSDAMSPAEACLTPGSYRDKLRANGQRALQRAWDCGNAFAPMPRPGPPPPPAAGGATSGSASPGGSFHSNAGGGSFHSNTGGGANNTDIAVGQDQYQKPHYRPQAQTPPPPWTSPSVGAPTFWPEASNEVPQASQMVSMSPLLTLPLTPSTMKGTSGQTDGLMAIAMPQCSDMNGEQIAAQLRAAAPMSYE